LLEQKSKEQAGKAGTTAGQSKSIKKHEPVLPRLHGGGEERVAKIAGTRLGESGKLHRDEWCSPQVHFHREENIAGGNEERVEERADKGMRKWMVDLTTVSVGCKLTTIAASPFPGTC
jgi:hypothetical protein